MTEPRTPDDQPTESDSPTQAWPSLTGPAATSAGEASTPAPATDEPTAPPAVTADEAVAPLTVAAGAAAATSTPGPIASPYEPASSLPPTRVATVGEGGTAGVPSDAPRGRSRLRWGLALVGVLIVAAGSFLIVSLVGGRPATSPAIGYMPASVMSYQEFRLDLPGDQRGKLASFLKPFPGFSDPSAIQPKLNDVLDRIVRAATKDKQTWTADIQPWFGGQIAIGAGLPDTTAAISSAAANDALGVATITDRAKAIAWITSTSNGASIDRSTYGDADLLVSTDAGGLFAIGVTDKVILAGTTVSVKAAIDTQGKSTFSQNDDVKAALATLDKDYVIFSVTRTRAIADAVVKQLGKTQPGVLDKTQLDETVLGLLPAWQVSTGRFENDAVVMSAISPSWAIGHDATNRASDVLGHVPAKAIVYLDSHDIGPALTAVLAKFRALPEAKAQFDQLDRALNLLGGFDAVFGWWGDTAFVASPLGDGTIGAGLVIHPRDAAAADRLLTTLGGFVALGGGSLGVTTRTEDHNGTKVTILDFSGAPGMSTTDLPPGYKPEFAWAANKDVVVVGYGSAFVNAVLDAGPGSSLADDPRFKALIGRVGADNLGMGFVDIAAIRGLIEPLAQSAAPPDAWAYYVREIQPYLKPLDAVVSNVRKDGANDRSTGVLTAH
jgi:hypothetical protein